MTLEIRLRDAFARAAASDKALRTLLNGNAADLSALLTTNKSSVVAALNELKGLIEPAGASISDSTTTASSTWSSQKTSDAIQAALAAITAGAPAALDTLNELSTALGNDANFAATITAALGKRVRVDAVQALTAGEKAQALANIGAQNAADIGNTDVDLVAVFVAALA